ncbi:SNAP25 protein [Datura stramonium]|uniref:SNAP25 protein n=1 Tax=Datura stramonium TaxID=4076 RepID=A0ABS8S8E0_DATST|nr:SNAP25 protein [Datura stramonium]
MQQKLQSPYIQQGEQIRKTHQTAADTEHDLSKGEKLLGSLGGLFSKTWRPKKIRSITGPVITRDDPVQRRGNHLEQREKLVLSSARKDRSSSGTPPRNLLMCTAESWIRHAKQDDALSDLSNLLGELKNMAVDMGQNKSLDHFQDDVIELNFRIKGTREKEEIRGSYGECGLCSGGTSPLDMHLKGVT